MFVELFGHFFSPISYRLFFIFLKPLSSCNATEFEKKAQKSFILQVYFSFQISFV